MTDTDGASPYGPLNLFDLWIIHKLVQFYIVSKTGWKAEVFIRSTVKTKTGYKQRVGFLDLYDAKNNSYYEVKHHIAAEMSYTEKQMQKYDNAHTISGYPGVSKPKRGYVAPSSSFSYGQYDVAYGLSRAGLITYTIAPKKALQVEHQYVYVFDETEERNAIAGYNPLPMPIPVFGIPIGAGGGGSAYDIMHEGAR